MAKINYININKEEINNKIMWTLDKQETYN